MNWRRLKVPAGTLFLAVKHAEALDAAGIRDFYSFLGRHTAKVQERTRTTFFVLRGMLPEGPAQVLAKRFTHSEAGQQVKDLFRWSKAVREFKQSFRLRDAGIAVPQPVAAFEAKKGSTPGESFFLVEDLPEARNVLDIARQGAVDVSEPRARHAFVRALGRFVGACHERGLFHGDLNGTNILASTAEDGSWRLVMIDFENVRLVKSLTLHQRVKDLARLEKSLGLHSRLTEGARFFSAYADGNEELLRKRKEIAGLIRRRILDREKSKRREGRADRKTERLIARYGRGGGGRR